MTRICEICGRVEEVQASEAQSSYEIVDVCQDCTEHMIYHQDEIEG